MAISREWKSETLAEKNWDSVRERSVKRKKRVNGRKKKL
jgi:hypothetical protein